jgi:hypothetical protein
MQVSVRADFERRIGLFPAWFAADGTLVTDTYLGSYPHMSTDVLSRKKNNGITRGIRIVDLAQAK